MFSKWISNSCFLLALAVIFGAFGAHGLKDILDPYSKEVYEKAVFYHLTHALGMLVVAVGAERSALGERAARRALWMLALGIALFSGSLYLLALSGMKWLGMVTPFGGTLFIVAWVSLALDLRRSSRQ